MEELVGTYASTKWTSGDGYVIGCLEDGTTVKGDANNGDLVPELTYRFFGYWRNHQTYGKQFHFKHFTSHVPHTRSGIVAYLAKICVGCGIGRQTAHRIFDAFGSEAVNVLERDPQKVVDAVPRLAIERAKKASFILAQHRQFRDAEIDLTGLFEGIGFPRTLIRDAIERWGSLAPARIRRDPFILLTGKFPGAGFARCDTLYLKLGHDPARLKRQALCAWDYLMKLSDGNTWHVRKAAYHGIKLKIGGTNPTPAKAVKLGLRSGLLAGKVDEHGVEWLSDGRSAANEAYVARKLKLLAAEPVEWPEIDSAKLDRHQSERLSDALVSPVAILIGSPGTGKTWTAASVIRSVIAKYGIGYVAAAAPTGKAAIRCTQAFRANDIDLEAKTIHRLLVPSRSGHGTGDWSFCHDEDNPLDVKFLIVDEVSMVHTDLLASLLRACAPGTHILFIGDTHQLPPVGHGAPLRDMVAAGMAVGELTEIRRNSGLIVKCCASIRTGGQFLSADRLTKEDNLKVVEVASPASAIQALESFFRTLRQRGTRDLVEDVQCLCPTRESSPLSNKQLNPFLQNLLNPDGTHVAGNEFRVGDKIMCMSNGWYPSAEDSKFPHYLANGEIGRVEEVTAHVFIGRFLEPGSTALEANGASKGAKVVRIPLKSDYASSFKLAYSITCHKGQGSEWPIVIVVVDESTGADRVMSREWIYTAISRASERCIVLGRKSVIGRRLKKVTLHHRKTFLRELLTQEEGAVVNERG